MSQSGRFSHRRFQLPWSRSAPNTLCSLAVQWLSAIYSLMVRVCVCGCVLSLAVVVFASRSSYFASRSGSFVCERRKRWWWFAYSFSSWCLFRSCMCVCVCVCVCVCLHALLLLVCGCSTCGCISLHRVATQEKTVHRSEKGAQVPAGIHQSSRSWRRHGGRGCW
jgi:hypothetical protein